MTGNLLSRSLMTFALACTAASDAGAAADNTPTPYTKCLGWLDRDDVHNFRVCFAAEMKTLIDYAARWHNAVLGRVQQFRDWPRVGGDATLLAAESCQRTRSLSDSLAASTRDAQQAHRVLTDTLNTLRAMNGQFTQHVSFRMRNREGVREMMNGAISSNLNNVESGVGRMDQAAAYYRSLRVADGCGQVSRPGAPDTYEDNVNYMGGDIRSGIAVNNVEACNWYCTNTVECRGFTFVRSGGTGHGICWMKSVMANRQRDACCISRIVRR